VAVVVVFETTATILITNILLILRVQFMEIGCQGLRKEKNKFWNRRSKGKITAWAICS
jgi:hypothetical protein